MQRITDSAEIMLNNKIIDKDMVLTISAYARIRAYLYSDMDFWMGKQLMDFIKPQIMPLLTSNNLFSKKIMDFFSDTVYIVQNLPFSFCFTVNPRKKKGYGFKFVIISEQKTERSSLMLVGSNFFAPFFVTTAHCYDRLCERLRLDRHQINIKELFAASLITDSRLLIDGDDAYLVFDGFMCLGNTINPLLYFFKTVITQDMYTADQQKISEARSGGVFKRNN
jgi:hypothetical protein